MYIKIPVPPDGSNLINCVEEYLNLSELVTVTCEDGCSKVVQAEKRSQLLSRLNA